MAAHVYFDQVKADLDAYVGPPVDDEHIRPTGTYWRIRSNNRGADVWMGHMPKAFVRIHCDPARRPGEPDHRVLARSLLDDSGSSPVEVFRLDGFVSTEEALVLALELHRRNLRVAATKQRP